MLWFCVGIGGREAREEVRVGDGKARVLGIQAVLATVFSRDGL